MKREKQKQKVCRVLGLFLAVVFFLGIGFKYNEQAQSASYYPYLIKVNRQACTITIYGKDSSGNYTVPVKAMLCSPGVGTLTPLGTYKTPAKYRWKLLMNDVWGQYSTRVVGGILFHSVWYYEQDPSTMSNREFNKLGTKASHGCIRITTEDAKWIYDNCPVGTTVTIYDSSNPGPLGKPEAIKVSTATRRGYDPTDVWTPNNPYTKKKTVISGTKNKTIEYGTKVDVTSGVKVTSSTNVDITSKLKVKITYDGKTVKKVDTKKVGSYYITYSAKDLLGKKDEKQVVYTVVDNEKPKISGVKEIYTNEKPNKETNKELALKNVTVKWHGKEVDKDDIKVTWKKLSDKDGLKKYKVTYSYKASNGKSVEASTTVYRDTKAPVLSGVKDGLVAKTKDLTKTNLVANVSVKDNLDALTTKNIKITKEKVKSGYYNIIYTVSDKAGNVTTAEALYRVKDGLVILGVEDKTITAEEVVNKKFAKQGVKAYNCGVDITSEMEIEITSKVNDEGYREYKVVYRIFDENGETAKKKAIFTVDTPVPEEELPKDETETPEDGTLNDETTETPEDGTLNDETPEIPEDGTVNDETTETPEDGTVNDETTETPNDGTVNDETETDTSNNETVNNETETDTSNDETVNDETETDTSNDETVNDETETDTSNDGTVNDETETNTSNDETVNDETETNTSNNETVNDETETNTSNNETINDELMENQNTSEKVVSE